MFNFYFLLSFAYFNLLFENIKFNIFEKYMGMHVYMFLNIHPMPSPPIPPNTLPLYTCLLPYFMNSS